MNPKWFLILGAILIVAGAAWFLHSLGIGGGSGSVLVILAGFSSYRPISGEAASTARIAVPHLPNRSHGVTLRRIPNIVLSLHGQSGSLHRRGKIVGAHRRSPLGAFQSIGYLV